MKNNKKMTKNKNQLKTKIHKSIKLKKSLISEIVPNEKTRKDGSIFFTRDDKTFPGPTSQKE